MIDGFEVPDDPGYGSDNYGKELSLECQYLLRHLLGLRSVFLPVASSLAETEARRGCVDLATCTLLRSELARIDLLRERAL